MDMEALKRKVLPGHTALIIIDMQRDYCCEGGVFHRRGFDIAPARKLAPVLNAFAGKVRPVLKSIVHLRMTRIEELFSPVAAELYDRLGIERNYDRGFADFYVVQPQRGDVVIPKYRYSGFLSTYLDQFLHLTGIRTMIVTGVATNVCVEATVRDAFMRDYYPVVPSDLTEASSPEAKAASLANIDAFFGQVVDSGMLLHCWGIEQSDGG
jgi:ureidoacrylate peracid hydrolase